MERFKHGLQERIRAELVRVINPPTDLQEFITFCDHIDKQLYDYRVSESGPIRSMPSHPIAINSQPKIHQNGRNGAIRTIDTWSTEGLVTKKLSVGVEVKDNQIGTDRLISRTIREHSHSTCREPTRETDAVVHNGEYDWLPPSD